MAKNKGKYSQIGNHNSGNKNKAGGIPTEATRIKRSTDNDTPLFSFGHLCDNNFMMHILGKTELKELHRFLKKISKMTWNQVRASESIGYKPIPRTSLSCAVPDSVSRDARIDEMRVTQEHRIFGFKAEGIFNIIWFDPTHDICPEGKKKRA